MMQGRKNLPAKFVILQGRDWTLCTLGHPCYSHEDSHEWVRWTPLMSELLSPSTRSISKASHKHRGASRSPEATDTFHPMLQALCLQVRGVNRGSWPARGRGCPLPGDAENPKLPVQFSLLSL